MNRAAGRNWKFAAFSLLPAALLTIAGAIWLWSSVRLKQGKALNQFAWEATYTERAWEVPPQGPREGYWGSRLGPKELDPPLGWREAARSVPGLLEIDAQGLQRASPRSSPVARVLIVGGSVAFGANASEISKTYFEALAQNLEKQGMPTEVVVMAAGAWKSMQELAALKRFLPQLNPDLVVLLNGLNDLTNGSTSQTVYGQPTPTHNGSEWTIAYHAQDYPQRVDDYVTNMRDARDACRASGAELLIVLQPSLAERQRCTAIEETLLARSLTPAAVEAHRTSYEAIRQRIPELLQSPRHFLDASRNFDSESYTTFADQWHFSDAGHQRLGLALAQRLAELISQRTEEPPGP